MMLLVLLLTATLFGYQGALLLGAQSLSRTGSAAILLGYLHILLASVLTGWARLFSLPYVALFQVLLLGLTIWLTATRHPERLFWRVRLTAGPWEPGLWLLPWAVTGIGILATIVAVLMLPSTNFDDLSYHLLMAATWHKEQAIGVFPAYGNLGLWFYYPGNGEVLAAWTMVTTGTDVVVDGIQLPFLLLTIFSLYGLCRSVGANRNSALWVTAAAASTPIVLIQSRSSYLDVIMAALLVTSVWYLLEWVRDRKPQTLTLLGLCAGLLVGLKGSGLLFAGVISLIVLLTLQRRTALLSLVGFGTLAIVAGGFWYLRNLFLTGSLTYPFRVGIAGLGKWKLFSGPLSTGDWYWSQMEKFVAAPRDWITYFFYDAHRNVAVFTHEAGFGPHFIGLGVPALAFGLVLFLARREWSRLSVCLAALAVVGAVFVGPMKEPRYIIATGLLTMAPLATMLDRPGSLVLRGLILVCVVFNVAVGTPGLFRSVQPEAVREAVLQRKRPDRYTILSRYGPEGRGWQALHLAAGGEPETVAYAATSLPYPLFGDQLQNRVLYVGLEGKSSSQWMADLRARGVTYFYVGDIPNPTLDKALKEQAHGLEELFRDGPVRVYRVVSPSRGESK